MKVELNNKLLNQHDNNRAESIIRSCVHCGFCLATCPTYQITGSELDSPRGRIYLIKSALEGEEVGRKSLSHLDRCLTCRACESTCPSGVEYGQLLDIGRQFLEPKRELKDKIKRFVVRKTLTSALFPLAGKLAKHSPKSAKIVEMTSPSTDCVLLLSGCVQPSLAPNINHATKQVLHRLGIEVIERPNGECCGAIDAHLSAQKAALKKIKRNLDNWCQLLDDGVSTILSTASGCGVMVKDYPHLFTKDDDYFLKAQLVSNATQDISEFIATKLNNASAEILKCFQAQGENISLHLPCTLQHGQKQATILPNLLTKLGYNISQPKDSHLCCGSAGTYSIFQPVLSQQLKQNKLSHLESSQPDLILTANIGCLMHLQSNTKTPVKHWIEILAN